MDSDSAELPAPAAAGTPERQDSGEGSKASKAGGSGASGTSVVDTEGPSKDTAKDEDAGPPPPAKLESKTQSKLSAASSKPSAKPSAVFSLRAAPSIITKISGSMLSARGPLRVRSAMSAGTLATSRSGASSSRGTTQSVIDRLSPGLQELIVRLANTKDVGLIAYLSAIPGEPLRASKPPAALANLQRKPISRPKSIMKISKLQVRYEPTYRTEPTRPFSSDRARALVQSALEIGLDGASYSEQWATDAARILAAYITQCIKRLDTQAPGSRYKIGTMVSVLERNWQGTRTEMAVLWDSDRDRFVAASVETSSMVALAVVYAVYWE